MNVAVDLGARNIGSPLLWATFLVGVLVVLAVDLRISSRDQSSTFKEAVWWSVFWIVLSVGFGFFVWFKYGGEQGLEYFAGYLTKISEISEPSIETELERVPENNDEFDEFDEFRAEPTYSKDQRHKISEAMKRRYKQMRGAQPQKTPVLPPGSNIWQASLRPPRHPSLRRKDRGA